MYGRQIEYEAERGLAFRRDVTHPARARHAQRRRQLRAARHTPATELAGKRMALDLCGRFGLIAANGR